MQQQQWLPLTNPRRSTPRRRHRRPMQHHLRQATRLRVRPVCWRWGPSQIPRSIGYLASTSFIHTRAWFSWLERDNTIILTRVLLGCMLYGRVSSLPGWVGRWVFHPLARRAVGHQNRRGNKRSPPAWGSFTRSYSSLECCRIIPTEQRWQCLTWMRYVCIHGTTSGLPFDCIHFRSNCVQRKNK